MAEIHGYDIIKEGLVLHLDAGNPQSYDGNSTQWRDLSGKGNNGTLTNSPTYNSAKKGCFIFDGTNDYVSIPTLKIYNSTQSHTYCAWVNQSTINSGYRWIIDNGTSNNGTSLILNGSKPAFFFSGGHVVVTTTTSVVSNTWNYVVVSYDGVNSKVDFYINGILDSSKSVGTTWTSVESTNSKLGMWFNTHIFYGNMSDIQVYSKYLSPQEILHNYNSTKNRYE